MRFNNIPIPKSNYYDLDKHGAIWIDVDREDPFNAGNINEYMSLQNKFMVCALFEKELSIRSRKPVADEKLLDLYNRLILIYQLVFDISEQEYFINEYPEGEVKNHKYMLLKLTDSLYLDGRFMDNSFINYRLIKAKRNKFQKMSKAAKTE
jgi:hypothetical protein